MERGKFEFQEPERQPQSETPQALSFAAVMTDAPQPPGSGSAKRPVDSRLASAEDKKAAHDAAIARITEELEAKLKEEKKQNPTHTADNPNPNVVSALEKIVAHNVKHYPARLHGPVAELLDCTLKGKMPVSQDTLKAIDTYTDFVAQKAASEDTFRPKEVLELQERALLIEQRKYGPHSKEVLARIDVMIPICNQRKDFERGIELNQIALQAFDKQKKPVHDSDVVQRHSAIADQLARMGRLDNAEKEFKLCIDATKIGAEGKDSDRVIRALREMGDFQYKFRKDGREAVKYLVEASDMAVRMKSDGMFLRGILNQTAKAQEETGMIDDSIATHLKIREMLHSKTFTGSKDDVASLNNIARLYELKGPAGLEDAIKYREEGVKLLEKQFANLKNMDGACAFSEARVELARLYNSKGDHQSASRHLTESLNYKMDLSKQDYPWIDKEVRGLGEICMKTKDYAEAEKYFQRFLNVTTDRFRRAEIVAVRELLLESMRKQPGREADVRALEKKFGRE